MGEPFDIGDLTAETDLELPRSANKSTSPESFRYVPASGGVRRFFRDPEVQKVLEDSPRARDIMRRFLDAEQEEEPHLLVAE